MFCVMFYFLYIFLKNRDAYLFIILLAAVNAKQLKQTTEKSTCNNEELPKEQHVGI